MESVATEKKLKLWLKIEQDRSRYQDRAESLIRGALNAQYRQFQNACIDQGGVSVDCVDAINEDPLREAIEKLYIMVGVGFARLTIGQGLKFRLSDVLRDYVRLNVAERIVGITASLKRRLKRTVADILVSGVANAEREIRSEFIGISRVRAQTIARTEIVSSSNFGTLMGAEQLQNSFQVQLRKVWLSTQDGRTRVTHSLADGQAKGMRDQFVVGGELLDFPGDPKGSAENVINCRCTLTYEVLS
jgi:hypothetical protein